MDLTSVFDRTITAENDPLIITGLTSPVVVVHLLPEILKGSYPEAPALVVEQILPNGGSPFIADRQLVEMKAEPVLVRLRANYPYSLRIDYPGWISRGVLKVWEVEDFNFFSTGTSSGGPIDLTGFVQTTDPRLTDARPPMTHTHGMDTIVGLQAALDAKINSFALAPIALAVWNGQTGGAIKLTGFSLLERLQANRYKFSFSDPRPDLGYAICSVGAHNPGAFIGTVAEQFLQRTTTSFIIDFWNSGFVAGEASIYQLVVFA